MINPYNYVDKDNKCKCNPVIIGMTGPRGPQGRQGDIGPTGPQGQRGEIAVPIVFFLLAIMILKKIRH